MACKDRQSCTKIGKINSADAIAESRDIVEYTENHLEGDLDALVIGDGKSSCKKAPIGFCPFMCVSIAVYAIILAAVSNLAMDCMIHPQTSWGSPVLDNLGRAITPDNVSSHTWWPGCESCPSAKNATIFEECGSGCFSAALPAFLDSQLSRGWRLVSYPSRSPADGGDVGRHEVVNLTAWYLDAGLDSPAVVVQHGMTASFNSVRVLLPAAMLRSAGFSVLIPNLRDHGTSDRSSYGKFAWGWDYPYDVLGAWDFLVSDPRGVLGGARAVEKVGFWGMSMGGFVSANAFGLEPRASALWLDGAVFDPRSVMSLNLPPVVSELFTRTVWWSLESRTGLSLRHHVPQQELAHGPPTKRPIFLTHSPGDGVVGVSEGVRYQQFISSMPEQYALHTWFQEATCNGESHCVTSLVHPAKYAAELCKFFSRSLLNTVCEVDFSKLGL